MMYSVDMARSYEKLIVWKEADDLCVFTYNVIKKFPPEEKFNLVSQMRRSSSGVATNIVEGNARQGIRDKTNFLTMSLSSLEELHYQYHLAWRLEYISKEVRDHGFDRIERVAYLITRLRTSLVEKHKPPSPSSLSSQSS